MAADPEGDRAVDIPVRAWLVPRLRLLATAGLGGMVLGLAGTLAATWFLGDARVASTQVFAVGALVLGLGVTGWSGTLLAGRGIETMQAHLDTGTDWSRADSRRAMARISAFGGGTMLGVVPATWLAPALPV